jgi:hypothetical protein
VKKNYCAPVYAFYRFPFKENLLKRKRNSVARQPKIFSFSRDLESHAFSKNFFLSRVTRAICAF